MDWEHLPKVTAALAPWAPPDGAQPASASSAAAWLKVMSQLRDDAQQALALQEANQLARLAVVVPDVIVASDGTINQPTVISRV